MIKPDQNTTPATSREKSKIPYEEKLQNSTMPENGVALAENTVKTYGALLAQRLRTSEKVKGHPMLRPGNWTKSSYEVLAGIIKEDLNKTLSPQQRIRMGISLSSRTLRKIALAEYKITQPADPRMLNTLNKVVIFLGYDHWQHFVSATGLTQHPTREKKPGQAITDAVKAAIHNTYRAYCELAVNPAELLAATHIKNSPSFNFIMDMVAQQKERKLIISNRFNPSTCEILDISVKKTEAAYAQVATKEYWRLCWWSPHEKRYVQRYKNISEHLYILNKVNGNWKVKTNASTADPMELK